MKRTSKTKSNPMGYKEKATLSGAIPLNAKDKGSGHGRLVNPNPDCMSFNVSSHSLHLSSVTAAKVSWHCSQPDWPNGSKTISSLVTKMKTPGITPGLQQVTPTSFHSQPQPHSVSTMPISFNFLTCQGYFDLNFETLLLKSQPQAQTAASLQNLKRMGSPLPPTSVNNLKQARFGFNVTIVHQEKVFMLPSAPEFWECQECLEHIGHFWSLLKLQLAPEIGRAHV